MTNLICNSCNTSQKPQKVLEVSIPFEFDSKGELKHLFLVVLDNCIKCGQKKMLAYGLTYLGKYVKYGYLKNKQFKMSENPLKSIKKLPAIKKTLDKKGFYLEYCEYGAVKRCYQNLSTMKTGLASNWDMLQNDKFKPILQSR